MAVYLLVSLLLVAACICIVPLYCEYVPLVAYCGIFSSVLALPGIVMPIAEIVIMIMAINVLG